MSAKKIDLPVITYTLHSRCTCGQGFEVALPIYEGSPEFPVIARETWTCGACNRTLEFTIELSAGSPKNSLEYVELSRAD